MRATPRKPTADRREEIVRAVLRIIGERGLTSLSTTTLAAEVGVTTGALYRHFASLEEILSETVLYGVDKVEETFPDETLPPIDRLMTLARNRIRLLGEDPGLAWLLRSDQAYLLLPEDDVQRLREVVGRSRRFVLGTLRDGVAAGDIRDDIEPDVLLVPVLATIHAVIGLRSAAGKPSRGSQRKPERVLAALAQLLAPPPIESASDSRPTHPNIRRLDQKETAR